MALRKFEYGPLSVGTFIALVSVTVLIGLYYPAWVIRYVLFLLFLVFGLRPLLERTGLLALYRSVLQFIHEKRHRKFVAQKQQEVDRKIRREKHRKSHYRDSRLPKNW